VSCLPTNPNRLKLLAFCLFQFPTGSVLSADVRFHHRPCQPFWSFNSPREVSCLPTRSSMRLANDTSSCFNSPREVSCLPTPPAERQLVELHYLFQFPTGSVLSADARAVHMALTAIARFNSPREVSCLPTTHPLTAFPRLAN